MKILIKKWVRTNFAIPKLHCKFSAEVLLSFQREFLTQISAHTFTLGDETSMAANVCGPAFGYLKTGVWLQKQGLSGIFTAAEMMPQFVR